MLGSLFEEVAVVVGRMNLSNRHFCFSHGWVGHLDAYSLCAQAGTSFFGMMEHVSKKGGR